MTTVQNPAPTESTRTEAGQSGTGDADATHSTTGHADATRSHSAPIAAALSAASGVNEHPTTLFVVTSLHGGGAEWVGRLWMQWLVERGHDVRVVVTSAKDTDAYLPAKVRVESLGALRGHAAKVARLRALVRASGADTVVALQMYPNLLAVAAAKLLPKTERPGVVVSEHNIVTYGLPGSPLSHRVKTRLARTGYPAADHLIAVSHAVAGEMIGGFGISEGHCTVVPNPAASKVPHRNPPKAPAGDLDVQLVIAHRLVPQKRPSVAVAAAAELAHRGLRVRLTVFGQGPLQPELERLAARQGVDLDLRGWAEQWFTEVTDRAVFLLASHREGFGNVLVEAAAAGIPCVALSGALGVADAVVPGLTGELALSADPVAIADAVERASRIEIGDIDAWLDRFTASRSGTALELVLDTVRPAR